MHAERTSNFKQIRTSCGSASGIAQQTHCSLKPLIWREIWFLVPFLVVFSFFQIKPPIVVRDVCPSVRPSVCLSLCPSIWLSIRLSSVEIISFCCSWISNRPTDIKFGLNVGYGAVQVWKSWFFKILIASCKFMQFTIFCNTFVCMVLTDVITQFWWKLTYMYVLRGCISEIIDIFKITIGSRLVAYLCNLRFFANQFVCTVLINQLTRFCWIFIYMYVIHVIAVANLCNLRLLVVLSVHIV